MAEKNNQWLEWIKCNILEIAILVLVVVLLVKVYSAPAVEENSAITTEEVLEPSVEDAAPAEAPLEEAPTEEPLVKELPAEEPAVEETPAE